MDGRRFDSLTRVVGTRVGRRGVVKGLTAAAIGALLRRHATDDASAACPNSCPAPEQYLGSACRCLCKTTGRPPVNGSCPCRPGASRCQNGVCSGQPVTIACPPNLESQCNPNVDFGQPAVTGPLGTTVSCSPASGTAFPNGTTAVTCTATGPDGCAATCGLTVTVGDTTPPSITCRPEAILPNDEGQCGAVFNFVSATVEDNCPNPSVSCTPPNGSFFPAGRNTVTCTATDAGQNQDSCSFVVTVVPDAIAFHGCGVINVDADPGQCGAVVTFPAPIRDTCIGSDPASSCFPASGSFFAVGVHTVFCLWPDINGDNCHIIIVVGDPTEPCD